MKVCYKCKIEKDLTEFHNSKRNPDGKEYRCKSCRSESSKVYGATEVAKAKKKANREKFKQRNRDYIKALLQKSKCTDCPEENWVVLEFDHLGDKLFDVSRIMNDNRLNTMIEEIKKCEIVCANCHKIRTYKRSNSWRVA